MILVIKEYSIILNPYSVVLAIDTNIPQRLKTAFVLQGHKCECTVYIYIYIYIYIDRWVDR